MLCRTALVAAALVAPLATAYSHSWPNGYNRQSRRTSWGHSNYQPSTSRQSPASASFSRQSPAIPSSPLQPAPSSYRQPRQPAPSPRQLQQPAPTYRQPRQPAPTLRKPAPTLTANWRRVRYPSYAERCGTCAGQPRQQVCGSDGKTYDSQCELENISCRKYWDLTVVSMGPCQATCPGVELGMYTGWGLSRASNNGYCTHDFFRCCKAARRKGLPAGTVRGCCQARADKCFAFVASKPWRSGITKYGK